MNIVKYIKDKQNFYIILLDNDTKIRIHEDLILKYNLLILKKIDKELYNKIIKENKIYEIYELSIKYLNKRLRSKKELSNYLSKKGYLKEDIDNTIKLLMKNNFLNDSLYIESYIHDCLLLSLDGPNKIVNYLISMDLDKELIDKYISVYNKDIELERIKKIISKKIKLNNNKGSNLLKQKIYYDLIKLGYNSNLINTCLNNIEIDDKEIYLKEYNKLYNKYKNKYKDKELQYIIKQKLYMKGFKTNNYE